MNLGSFKCCFRKSKKEPSPVTDVSLSNKSSILVRDGRGMYHSSSGLKNQDDTQTEIPVVLVDKDDENEERGDMIERKLQIHENQNDHLDLNNSVQSEVDDVTVTVEVDEAINNNNENTVLQNLHAGADCDIQHPNNSERGWVFTWTHWMSLDT